MKKEKIMNAINQKIARAGFALKKHSPEILLAAGIGGAIVSAVMACRETTKISAILDKTKQDLDAVHTVLDNGDSEKYSVEDGRKDTVIIYAQTGWELAKLYAPSVTLGALSITSILASNNILRKRNVALAAAYTAVDKSYKEYRKRVAERFGEDVDRELRFNIKAREVEETVIDEDGKEKTIKKTVETADIESCSPYARYFDSGNPYWDVSSDHNYYFLRAQQSYMNDVLKIKGHITLNEAYELLGFPTTKAGMVVGWIFDENNPVGDNYIDLGLHRIQHETDDGEREAILLDFNVDGNIFDRM